MKNKMIDIGRAIAAGADAKKLGVTPVHYVVAGTNEVRTAYIAGQYLEVIVTSSRLIGYDVKNNLRTGRVTRESLGAATAWWFDEPSAAVNVHIATGRYAHTAPFAQDEYGVALVDSDAVATGEVDVLRTGAIGWKRSLLSPRYAALGKAASLPPVDVRGRNPHRSAQWVRMRKAIVEKTTAAGHKRALRKAGDREVLALTFHMMNEDERAKWSGSPDYARSLKYKGPKGTFTRFVEDAKDLTGCCRFGVSRDGRKITVFGVEVDEDGFFGGGETSYRFATESAAVRAEESLKKFVC